MFFAENGFPFGFVVGISFNKNSLKLGAIYALIEPKNIGSVKVINKTGFQFIKSSVFRGFKIDVYQLKL